MLKKAYDYAIAIVRKNLRRSAKYSLNGFLGFGIVELITLIGITYLDISHILLIDSAAFVSGVALEFFLNEYWTTKNQGFHGSHIFGLLFRLLKFEIMNIVGTSLAVSVQFTLFKLFALNPLIGNIIGSAFAFPINYYIQMRVVWKIRITDDVPKG
ncbi:MAG: GtrA family protein [Thermoplasmatales archaeon]|nr:GtrA family protein [Thermoplasmatales archaeon]